MVSVVSKSNSLLAELRRFDSTLPLAQASTIPSSWYTSEEMYQAEVDSIFLDSWQFAARADQLKRNGDFVSLDIAGEPVVVVRDQEGCLRAFSNVCRHRAARITCQEAGSTGHFQCRYHGWSYDLSGRLRGAPEFSGVANFDKKGICLPTFDVCEYGPFVFINMRAGGSSEPLSSLIDSFQERHSKSSLEKLQFVERREYLMDCNWKVFVDNYLDGGYHVRTLHPALSDVLEGAEYKTETHRLSSLQTSPLKSGAVSSVRSGDLAYYWWMFPNFMVNIYEGLMDTNLVIPIGPDRCRVIFDFYFENTKDRDFISESIKVADQVQEEDMSISLDVQNGLRCRSYDTGRFSVSREAGGYHFHKLLADWLERFVAGSGE